MSNRGPSERNILRRNFGDGDRPWGQSWRSGFLWQCREFVSGISSHSPSLSSYRLPANIVQPSESALRGVVAGRPSPHYYKVLMPTWAFQLAPTELSTAEREAVDRLRP